VRKLLARNPEALVMTGGHHSDATRELVINHGLPVIEIWDLPQNPLGHVVGFSNATAMRVLVEHLALSGHRKRAFVGASDGTDLRRAERRAGTLALAEALGLPQVTVLDAGPAPVSMRRDVDLAARLGQDLRSFDPILCVSDPLAFGVFSACRRHGIDV